MEINKLQEELRKLIFEQQFNNVNHNKRIGEIEYELANKSILNVERFGDK